MSLETTDRTAGQDPRPVPAATLDRLVATLTLEEKVALVVGAGMWATTAIDRIGLRAVTMSDGPVGVRPVTPEHADGAVRTSAMFPAPSALAATWDLDLARRAGELFAAEARRHDVDVVLAPQVNLQRTPVGGRHFECYSEDPHLTAEVAVALVAAAQDCGVGMSVKHYVANDSETERTRYLAQVDERTLREVYLAPFERLVHDARAWSVMGAYSGVDDGTAAAPALEHRPLLTGVLKDEWGFDGVVVSDWVATKTVGPAVRGGLDLQMPGPDGAWGDGLLAAVRAGDVAEHELDDKVLRLLRLAVRVGALAPDDAAASDPAAARHPGTFGEFGTTSASSAYLRELTARAMVVLKDDAGLLPLDVAGGAGGTGRPTVSLLGPGAVDLFLQGGGSSFVVPDHVSDPVAELRAALPGVDVTVHAGARPRHNPPALDVAATCRDPRTGGAGVRVELLDAAGEVLATRAEQPWDGWGKDLRPDAATLRLSAELHLTTPGTHALGVGTIGVHEVRLDDELLTRGDQHVGVEIVLGSGHNHPVAVVREVEVPAGGRVVRLHADLQVVHPVGYDSFVRAELVHGHPGPSAEEEIAEAVAAAAAADVAIVVVGTTEEVESEGYDRPSLALPGNQDELVARVLAANPRTVVVVNAGAPVLLPWLDRAPTVLWAWLPGQEGGAALADVLTGVTEPSGRLPWTLPARAEDVPVPHAIPVDGVVAYTEGIHVGYRGWELAGTTPAAPFGHGLGWTTWTYDDVAVQDDGVQDDGPAEHPGEQPSTHPTARGGDVVVSVVLRNDGARRGREVVQVYVEPADGPEPGATDPHGNPARPVRWLGGFATVDADAGETVTAHVRVPRRAFETWDAEHHRWTTPPGDHALRVGRSVRDLRLRAVVPHA
ncbi:beta-d-glucosidase [Sediminihabitans luteus]|uniref:beta-d-glucosidase n=1 Tax=Sediminihabitans luteus TaxID=1138585 RepID=UPI001EF1F8FE|nr:glycoside hydrolase family 3 protein [Sediminihabitans luteus]